MFKNWNCDGLETMYRNPAYASKWEADRFEEQNNRYDDSEKKVVVVHRYSVRYTHS